jgi:hypothetical protein
MDDKGKPVLLFQKIKRKEKRRNKISLNLPLLPTKLSHLSKIIPTHCDRNYMILGFSYLRS